MTDVICQSSYLDVTAMSDDRKHSRRQQSHERILDAAARAVCRDGYAGLGVASVMKEAGLTHGGFYAHFDSRDALLAAAVEHAGIRSAERMRERMQVRVAGGASALRAFLEEYLSARHVEALDQGCPVAALGADLARGEAALRALAARRVRHLAEALEQALPPAEAAAGGSGAAAAERSGDALVIASTLVGAVQIARVLEGEQRDAVLRNCRDALLARYDRPAAG
jgi:TetR/AcrR family transcriptional repressor of nem operon